MRRGRHIEEPDEPYVVCASCERQLPEAEAAELDGRYYHPDCAGVWRCEECEKWNENGQKCPCCKPEAAVAENHGDDLMVVLAGLALILAFALGLVLGVKVEQADQKLAARQATVDVAR